MVAGRNVLLVEDDELVRASIVDGLEQEGANVTVCESGSKLLEAELAAKTDIVLLDLRLPETDGLSLLREFRQISDKPVIIITGNGDEFDEFTGLEIGADDFVRKPFAFKVLFAHIRAVMRRYDSASGHDSSRQLELMLTDLDWRIDRQNRTLVGPEGKKVSLTATEFRILCELAANTEEHVNRQELYGLVFNRDLPEKSRTIEVLISRLRQKIADPATGPVPLLIESAYGKGYRLGGVE
jgi:DNA-binding response OmpR family regulator